MVCSGHSFLVGTATSAVSSDIQFVCPRDRAELSRADGELLCARCGNRYPIARGLPILIDDEASVFSRGDYLARTSYSGASYGKDQSKKRSLRGLYQKWVASVSAMGPRVGSLNAREAVQRMRDEFPSGRVLSIGAGEFTFDIPGVIYTDVVFRAQISCICDAHSLPFRNGYFDGVVAVAVLEHVADPYRCVDEIRRVLSDGGLVYAVTPFLQPVHMGAHDFTRFTYLGHRRLFRWFDDLESGCALGPGASAGYVFQHLLLCISDAHWYRRVAKLAGIISSALIKQVDRIVGRRRGAYDAAAGTFFFGRKRRVPISDRNIIQLYRGAQV